MPGTDMSKPYTPLELSKALIELGVIIEALARKEGHDLERDSMGLMFDFSGGITTYGLFYEDLEQGTAFWGETTDSGVEMIKHFCEKLGVPWTE